MVCLFCTRRKTASARHLAPRHLGKEGSGHMKRVLSATIGLLAISAMPAIAADLPVKARPMAPVVTAYNWTGCYIGGNVGGKWARIGRRCFRTDRDRGRLGAPEGVLSLGEFGYAHRRRPDWLQLSAGRQQLGVRRRRRCRLAALVAEQHAWQHRASPVRRRRHLRSPQPMAGFAARPHRLCLGSLDDVRHGRRGFHER